MGLSPPLIYLDACVVIYFVEQPPLFGPVVREAVEKRVGSQFCVSPLVELECRVLPLRTGNQSLAKHYGKRSPPCR